mgnify:CR=1 FL=1
MHEAIGSMLGSLFCGSHGCIRLAYVCGGYWQKKERVQMRQADDSGIQPNEVSDVHEPQSA